MLQLPDSFADFATQHLGGKGINSQLMAHCQRESIHAQWAAMLDDEFIEAYWHGEVMTCSDGVIRRAFPRIFTYSADYPEKYVKAHPICVFREV